jgi:hypothetical protein
MANYVYVLDHTECGDSTPHPDNLCHRQEGHKGNHMSWEELCEWASSNEEVCRLPKDHSSIHLVLLEDS